MTDRRVGAVGDVTRRDGDTRARIAMTVAELNGCDYCLSAHTYLGTNAAPLDPGELTANRGARSSDTKAEAALQFAARLVEHRGHVAEADELDYRLIKEVWAFTTDRIAVRFVYECRTPEGVWKRALGNEQWEFDDQGLMRRREASINDVAISEEQRLFAWPLGPRPPEHPGLSELGL